MTRHDIRIRRGKFGSHRIQRHKDYSQLLQRHRKSSRIRSIIILVLILLVILLIIGISYFAFLQQQPGTAISSSLLTRGVSFLQFNCVT